MASAPATMTGAMPDDGLPVVASRKPDRLGLATGLAIVAFLGLAVFWILNAGREAENSANPVVAAVDPAQRILRHRRWQFPQNGKRRIGVRHWCHPVS